MNASLQTALKAADRWDTIRSTLEAYGRGLDDAGRITRDGRPTGVVLELKGPRTQARSDSGALLWSGADVSSFLESFWFAVRAGGVA
jgi:hypothetical protein